MELLYPLQAILIYLALLFAPADAERISFDGLDQKGTLIRDASGWNFAGPAGNVRVKINGSRLVSDPGGQAESVELRDYVANAAGHDWAKQPKLTLHDANTLEKTAEGFTLRNNRGKEGIHAYTILFHRPGEPAGGPTCNVLGAVAKPGIYPLRDGSTLYSVLLSAGSPSGPVSPFVRILRREPGGKRESHEECNLTSVLEGTGSDPVIRDHDTIYVAPTVLLALTRDGTFTFNGEPCPFDTLAALLRDRVESGVRSATLTAPAEMPAEKIQPLRDACVAAGIPSHALRSTAPE